MEFLKYLKSSFTWQMLAKRKNWILFVNSSAFEIFPFSSTSFFHRVPQAVRKKRMCRREHQRETRLQSMLIGPQVIIQNYLSVMRARSRLWPRYLSQREKYIKQVARVGSRQGAEQRQSLVIKQLAR